MGVDISGGIYIGAWARSIPREAYDSYGGFYEFEEEHELERVSPYYDADWEDCFIGEKVANIFSSDLDLVVSRWKGIAERLEKLLQTKIHIVGMQNVW